MNVPDGHDDSSESYELDGKLRRYVFKRPPKVKSVKELEEELEALQNPVEPVEGEEGLENPFEEEKEPPPRNEVYLEPR